jgi:hypothetical protein
VEELSYPSTRFGPSIPTPASGFTGVLVASRPMIHLGSRMILSGVYQLHEAEAERIDAHLHHALCVVVTSADLARVLTPFREVVLFDDDDERFPWGRRGYFQVDVFEGADPPRGDYFLHVALGEHLSNTVEVAVRG